jgi:hypothetical protein
MERQTAEIMAVSISTSALAATTGYDRKCNVVVWFCRFVHEGVY